MDKPDTSANGTNGNGVDSEHAPKTPPPKPKTKAKYVFHARYIIDALLVFFALFVVGVARLFRPGFWSTIVYFVIGIPIGIVASYLYYHHTRSRRKIGCMLHVEPGAKGLQSLVQKIPTWINLSDDEKLEWLNACLEEVWPYYDAAVCDMVVEVVSPILDSYKPPFMKSLGFSKLRFGDAPIRFEAVRMHRDRDDCVFLEFDVRWAGDAEIRLAIDLLGSSIGRMVPKISKLRLVGTVGIQLRPLVGEIPAFGCVIATLLKPPKISYQVDLGAALGGNITGNAVEAFLATLLPDILNGFLVWPQRIVTPILDEKVIGPLEDYALRHQGILKVCVVEAKDIPRMDRMGTSDPYVEIFTDPKRKLKTSTKKNTLTPTWNEEFYLMVQEPLTQMMRLEMFDVDFVNAKQLLKVNIVKGLKDAVHSTDTMCKGAIELRDVCEREPGHPVERWYPLGSSDWSSDYGPGSDCGEIKLRMTYVPLTRTNPMRGDYGVLVVTLKTGREFPQMVPGRKNSCNPYAVAKVGNDKQQSTTQQGTCSPDWMLEKLEFYNCPNEQELKIKFLHDQALQDEEIGHVTIEIRDVRESKYRHQRGALQKEYELQDADSGFVTIECLFVPYF